MFIILFLQCFGSFEIFQNKKAGETNHPPPFPYVLPALTSPSMHSQDSLGVSVLTLCADLMFNADIAVQTEKLLIFVGFLFLLLYKVVYANSCGLV